DGTVRCWGLNDYGQLGNGTQTEAETPATATGRRGAVEVTGGGYPSWAGLRAGEGRGCGRRRGGRRQRGGGEDGCPQGDGAAAAPVMVQGITTAGALEAGVCHTCALLQDGRMQCWGWNDFCQLGSDPPAANASSTPLTVNGITNPAVMAPGAEQSCVVLRDGR